MVNSIYVLRCDIQIEGPIIVETIHVTGWIVVALPGATIFDHPKCFSRCSVLFVALHIAELLRLATQVMNEVRLLQVLQTLLSVHMRQTVTEGWLICRRLILLVLFELVHITTIFEM